MIGTKFHVTLTETPSGITWRIWRGITDPYELLASGTATTWAAAGDQAGGFLTRRQARESSS